MAGPALRPRIQQFIGCPPEGPGHAEPIVGKVELLRRRHVREGDRTSPLAQATAIAWRPFRLRHLSEESTAMKHALLGAVALLALPMAAANAQSMFTSGPANPGFYIGAEGGLNWLLNNNGYSTDTGYAVGGKVGYDFVGPRVELEGLYRNNRGSGTVQYSNGAFGFVNGQIDDLGDGKRAV